MRKTSVLLMIASDLYFSKLPQTSNYQTLIESLLLMIYNLMLVTGAAVERRVLVVFDIKRFKSLLINIKLFCSLK